MMVRHTAHIKFISPIPIPITFLPLRTAIIIDVEWCIVYQRATRVELTEKMHHDPSERKCL